MSRLLTTLALATLAVAAAPGAAAAQQQAGDQENPPVLRLSFYKCDYNVATVEEIEQALATRDIPVWRQVANEGMVEEHGYFFHAWADEWNVGIYTIAESIPAIIEASDEANRRLEQEYGDEPGILQRGACPQHRDGFYVLGPSTGMNDEEAGGN